MASDASGRLVWLRVERKVENDQICSTGVAQARLAVLDEKGEVTDLGDNEVGIMRGGER